MAVIILGYRCDPAFMQVMERIASGGAADYGFMTQMGKPERRPFGTVVSGEVCAGRLKRTFICAELEKGSALSAAIQSGYTSGNCILVATAIEEQTAALVKRGFDLYRGYAVLLRESVPFVSELGNALLVTGEPDAAYACEDRIGDMAASALRMIFSETIGKKPFAPRRRRQNADAPAAATHDLEG